MIGTTEQRSHARYASGWRVRICSDRKVVGIGCVRDVSRNGALLEASLYYKDGEKLDLEIFPLYRGERRCLDAGATVVHHKPLRNGRYTYGVAFSQIPEQHSKLLHNVLDLESGTEPAFDDSELGLD